MSRKGFIMNPSTGRTEVYFKKARQFDPTPALHEAGKRGVAALSAATPEDSGLTAQSWRYEVVKTARGYSVDFHNDNISPGGALVAILLQYGHATRGGTYVQGRDYVNPALASIFDDMATEIWKGVL
jgi:hypothetical protein